MLPTYQCFALSKLASSKDSLSTTYFKHSSPATVTRWVGGWRGRVWGGDGRGGASASIMTSMATELCCLITKSKSHTSTVSTSTTSVRHNKDRHLKNRAAELNLTGILSKLTMVNGLAVDRKPLMSIF